MQHGIFFTSGYQPSFLLIGLPRLIHTSNINVFLLSFTSLCSDCVVRTGAIKHCMTTSCYVASVG